MSGDPFFADYFDGGDIADRGFRHRDEGGLADEELAMREARDVIVVDPELSDAGAACRVCGCNDEAACPEGCVWAEADLCSRCARGLGRDA